MKHLLVFLAVLTCMVLAACSATPTPDLEATVQAAVAATQAAQPTNTFTPEPTDTPTPEPTDTSTPTPTDTPTPVPTDTPVPTSTAKPTDTPEPTATSAPTAPPVELPFIPTPDLLTDEAVEYLETIRPWHIELEATLGRINALHEAYKADTSLGTDKDWVRALDDENAILMRMHGNLVEMDDIPPGWGWEVHHDGRIRTAENFVNYAMLLSYGAMSADEEMLAESAVGAEAGLGEEGADFGLCRRMAHGAGSRRRIISTARRMACLVLPASEPP